MRRIDSVARPVQLDPTQGQPYTFGQMEADVTANSEILRALAMLSESLAILDSLGESVAAANLCSVIEHLDRHLIGVNCRQH